MSLKDAILKAVDRKREAVDVSEFWPEAKTVYIAVMDGTARDSWECNVRDALNEKKDLTALYLVRCLEDENGARIFTDEDVTALGSKNWQALDKLYDVAVRLNKTSRAALEELEKNSVGPTGTSS